MNNAILLPMLSLAGWTMIVWIWMYATRLPAMSRAGIDGTRMVGSTGESLALMGEAGALAVNLAWSYTGLRVVHSLVQIISNRVLVRFAVFALASLCLMGLVVIALGRATG
jgi:hypothetical protein